MLLLLLSSATLVAITIAIATLITAIFVVRHLSAIAIAHVITV
jgi:hypothetical protein